MAPCHLTICSLPARGGGWEGVPGGFTRALGCQRCSISGNDTSTGSTSLGGSHAEECSEWISRMFVSRSRWRCGVRPASERAYKWGRRCRRRPHCAGQQRLRLRLQSRQDRPGTLRLVGPNTRDLTAVAPLWHVATSQARSGPNATGIAPQYPCFARRSSPSCVTSSTIPT